MQPQLGADRRTNGMTMRTGMRNQRYGEVLLVNRHQLHAEASVYNTIGLNDCPEAEWRALDPESIKKAHHAMTVLLNGPRYFMMDRNALQLDNPDVKNQGEIATFGTLQMRLLATVKIPLTALIGGAHRQSYTENTVKRTTTYVYEAGKKVYELIAEKGSGSSSHTVYVLQSYAQIIDPTLDEGALDTLGSRLHLPSGWRYQVRTLEQDLVLHVDQDAYVLQDDLQNSYQRV